MRQVCRIGLDIAKLKFQIHGVDMHGKDMFNKQLQRKDVLTFFANLPACVVGLEACGGAHYWAREIRKLGHDARLISPRLVKPFVINNKTDAADARAICEVVGRPSTKFVNVKTVEQQDLMALHRIRERLVGNRTALVNQARGCCMKPELCFHRAYTIFESSSKSCSTVRMHALQQLQRYILQSSTKSCAALTSDFLP